MFRKTFNSIQSYQSGLKCSLTWFNKSVVIINAQDFRYYEFEIFLLLINLDLDYGDFNPNMS